MNIPRIYIDIPKLQKLSKGSDFQMMHKICINMQKYANVISEINMQNMQQDVLCTLLMLLAL